MSFLQHFIYFLCCEYPFFKLYLGVLLSAIQFFASWWMSSALQVNEYNKSTQPLTHLKYDRIIFFRHIYGDLALP
jgi:hypothetical protein